jgi:hypothetical protein
MFVKDIVAENNSFIQSFCQEHDIAFLDRIILEMKAMNVLGTFPSKHLQTYARQGRLETTQIPYPRWTI